MDAIQYIVMLLVGVGLGAITVWLILRAQIAVLNAKSNQLETTLQDERRQTQEKIAFLDDAQQKLSDTFKALAADTLQRQQ